MARRFHIKPDSGEPGKCKAKAELEFVTPFANAYYTRYNMKNDAIAPSAQG